MKHKPESGRDANPVVATGPKVVVSMTTIPSRMAGIETCVASLAAQTRPPDRIYLCVPRRYRRFETPDSFPFDLSRFGSLVEIVRCEDDGPGTKLLGAFDRVPKTPDTLLVLVDDDLVYRPHMLETFVETFRANPRAAASFHVYRYRGYRIGQGADGFALPVSLMEGLEAYHGEVARTPESFYVDDLWLSYFLWMKGIPVIDLAHKAGPEGCIYQFHNDVDALSRETGRLARRRVMRRTLWSLRRRFGMRVLATRIAARLRPGARGGP